MNFTVPDIDRLALEERYEAAEEAESFGDCGMCGHNGVLCLDCGYCFMYCHPEDGCDNELILAVEYAEQEGAGEY